MNQGFQENGNPIYQIFNSDEDKKQSFEGEVEIFKHSTNYDTDSHENSNKDLNKVSTFESHDNDHGHNHEQVKTDNSNADSICSRTKVDFDCVRRVTACYFLRNIFQDEYYIDPYVDFSEKIENFQLMNMEVTMDDYVHPIFKKEELHAYIPEFILYENKPYEVQQLNSKNIYKFKPLEFKFNLRQTRSNYCVIKFNNAKIDFELFDEQNLFLGSESVTNLSNGTYYKSFYIDSDATYVVMKVFEFKQIDFLGFVRSKGPFSYDKYTHDNLFLSFNTYLYNTYTTFHYTNPAFSKSDLNCSFIPLTLQVADISLTCMIDAKDQSNELEIYNSVQSILFDFDRDKPYKYHFDLEIQDKYYDNIKDMDKVFIYFARKGKTSYKNNALNNKIHRVKLQDFENYDDNERSHRIESTLSEETKEIFNSLDAFGKLMARMGTLKHSECNILVEVGSKNSRVHKFSFPLLLKQTYNVTCFSKTESYLEYMLNSNIGDDIFELESVQHNHKSDMFTLMNYYFYEPRTIKNFFGNLYSVQGFSQFCVVNDSYSQLSHMCDEYRDEIIHDISNLDSTQFTDLFKKYGKYLSTLFIRYEYYETHLEEVINKIKHKTLQLKLENSIKSKRDSVSINKQKDNEALKSYRDIDVKKEVTNHLSVRLEEKRQNSPLFKIKPKNAVQSLPNIPTDLKDASSIILMRSMFTLNKGYDYSTHKQLSLLGMKSLMVFREIVEEFRDNHTYIEQYISNNSKEEFKLEFNHLTDPLIQTRLNNMPKYKVWMFNHQSQSLSNRQISWVFRVGSFEFFVFYELGLIVGNCYSNPLWPIPFFMQFRDFKEHNCESQEAEPALNDVKLVQNYISAFVQPSEHNLEDNYLNDKYVYDIILNTHFNVFSYSFEYKKIVMDFLSAITNMDCFVYFTFMLFKIKDMIADLKNINNFKMLNYVNFESDFEVGKHFMACKVKNSFKFFGWKYQPGKKNDLLQDYYECNCGTDLKNVNTVTVLTKVSNRPTCFEEFAEALFIHYENKEIYQNEFINDSIEAYYSYYVNQVSYIYIILYYINLYLYFAMVYLYLNSEYPYVNDKYYSYLIHYNNTNIALQIMFLMLFICETWNVVKYSSPLEVSRYPIVNSMKLVFNNVFSEKIIDIIKMYSTISVSYNIKNNLMYNIEPTTAHNETLNVQIILGSFFIIVNMINYLKYFTGTQKFIMILYEIIKDLKYVMLVTCVMIMALCSSFYFLYSIINKAAVEEGMEPIDGGLFLIFFRSVKLSLIGDMDLVLYPLREFGEDFVQAINPNFIDIIRVYIMVVVVVYIIVMLNFVIAVMSDTYSKVTDNMIFYVNRCKTKNLLEWYTIIKFSMKMYGCLHMERLPYKFQQILGEKTENEWVGQVQNIKKSLKESIDPLSAKMNRFLEMNQSSKKDLESLELQINKKIDNVVQEINIGFTKINQGCDYKINKKHTNQMQQDDLQQMIY